jgi:hypothetical protein
MFDKLLVAINNPQTPATPLSVPSSPSSAIPPGSPPAPPEGFVDQILAFIYTSAHWLGGIIVNLLEYIVPLQSPEKLVDPIGYLALLTLFLIVAEVAKKITWLIVIVGWVLIIIRIITETRQM